MKKSKHNFERILNIFIVFMSLFILLYYYVKIFIIDKSIKHKVCLVNETNINKTENVSSNSSLTIIPVSFSLDEGYLFPTLVAMTSLFINKKPTTKYINFILLNSQDDIKKFSLLKDLEKKYTNVEIKFIQINEKNYFYKFKTLLRYNGTKQTYYRILLPDLIKEYDKLIYLDGDVLVLDDLSEMYNIDIKDNLYLGMAHEEANQLEIFPQLTHDKLYICAGVLLMNLKVLREQNLPTLMVDFAKKYHSFLLLYDQTLINFFGLNKKGLLPPKYGMYGRPYSSVKKRNTQYDKFEFEEAYRKPSVLHFINYKPWDRYYDVELFQDLWWFYANKTGHYEQIKLKYNYDKDEF